jgi:hypothetical protein
MDSIEELPPREDSLSHQSPQADDLPIPNLPHNPTPPHLDSPPSPRSPTHSQPKSLPIIEQFSQPLNPASPQPSPSPTPPKPHQIESIPDPLPGSQSPESPPDTHKILKSTIGKPTFRYEESISALNCKNRKGRLGRREVKSLEKREEFGFDLRGNNFYKAP